MTSPTSRIVRRLRRTWRTRPAGAAGSALRTWMPRSTGSTRKASREPDRRLPGDGVTQPGPYPRRGQGSVHADASCHRRAGRSALSAECGRWGATGVYRLPAGDIRILYEVDDQAATVYIIDIGIIA